MPTKLTIKPSPKSDKKYVAIFTRDNGRTKRVHFGGSGYSDYTKHKDKERRRLYRSRHRNDRINDPETPGSLSWYILWGDSTSMKENIKKFKNKFRLT